MTFLIRGDAFGPMALITFSVKCGSNLWVTSFAALLVAIVVMSSYRKSEALLERYRRLVDLMCGRERRIK